MVVFYPHFPFTEVAGKEKQLFSTLHEDMTNIYKCLGHRIKNSKVNPCGPIGTSNVTLILKTFLKSDVGK